MTHTERSLISGTRLRICCKRTGFNAVCVSSCDSVGLEIKMTSVLTTISVDLS